jgi:aromatic ring-opening dioxygenase catalytic subunit (LigB family)
MPVTQPALQSQLPHHLVELGKQVQASKPQAILVISAHWEVCLLCLHVPTKSNKRADAIEADAIEADAIHLLFSI